jgi:hypothetical protein
MLWGEGPGGEEARESKGKQEEARGSKRKQEGARGFRLTAKVHSYLNSFECGGLLCNSLTLR